MEDITALPALINIGKEIEIFCPGRTPVQANKEV